MIYSKFEQQIHGSDLLRIIINLNI
jgi:hypothetical protein